MKSLAICAECENKRRKSRKLLCITIEVMEFGPKLYWDIALTGCVAPCDRS